MVLKGQEERSPVLPYGICFLTVIPFLSLHSGGLPWWLRRATCLQCGRPRFDSWIGKIPPEKGMATHSSLLAWRIPWTEEPGGLQSKVLRVGHE